MFALSPNAKRWGQSPHERWKGCMFDDFEETFMNFDTAFQKPTLFKFASDAAERGRLCAFDFETIQFWNFVLLQNACTTNEKTKLHSYQVCIK